MQWGLGRAPNGEEEERQGPVILPPGEDASTVPTHKISLQSHVNRQVSQEEMQNNQETRACSASQAARNMPIEQHGEPLPIRLAKIKSRAGW